MPSHAETEIGITCDTFNESETILKPIKQKVDTRFTLYPHLSSFMERYI